MSFCYLFNLISICAGVNKKSNRNARFITRGSCVLLQSPALAPVPSGVQTGGRRSAPDTGWAIRIWTPVPSRRNYFFVFVFVFNFFSSSFSQILLFLKNMFVPFFLDSLFQTLPLDLSDGK